MAGDIPEMISLEDARELVLSKVQGLPVETVGLLDAVGRVAAADVASDMDVAPFAHAAMDGFALRAGQIAAATPESPVELDVVAEVPAGGVFDGATGDGQCVRIMTGAALPACADAVVKYEIVDYLGGDGLPGSRVAFTAPAKPRANVREAGEEARAGEVVVSEGEVIGTAGVGFLAGCGAVEVPVRRRPRVAVIATGSELVTPPAIPGPGKIRNSNGFALSACVQAAGGIPTMLPAMEDSLEGLKEAVSAATREYDFVVTSGGAANGDYDFIKRVVDETGELLMTTVNMRPGKAQTFGLVNGTPVFGLPGNPAAAYVGFETLVRPALRKMQGYTHFERPRVKARLAADTRKRDPRRLFLRGTLRKASDGAYVAATAHNQSSGLFGPLQRCNCLVILPEGTGDRAAGDVVECMLLDVSEELDL